MSEEADEEGGEEDEEEEDGEGEGEGEDWEEEGVELVNDDPNEPSPFAPQEEFWMTSDMIGEFGVCARDRDRKRDRKASTRLIPHTPDLGFGNMEDEETEDDPDVLADPLYSLDLKSFLKELLLGLAQQHALVQDIMPMLTRDEQEALRAAFSA
jgi:hypothetical protein